MRIAVVGAGVSGLVAARLLHRAHDVTVFEADDRPGGHAHTVDVEVGGRRLAVDTGFIVYNEATYPCFSRLLAELGVATQPSDMSFGVRCEASGIEWASPSLSTVLAQRRNLLRPGFRRMLRDVLRFMDEARALVDMPEEKASLGEWLCGRGYSPEFTQLYAIPMGAAIWSADPSAFLEFPAASFARFFANHGLLERPSPVRWRTVTGGSRRYVEALVAPFRERLRLATPVARVRRHAVGVEVVTADRVSHAFDRVVLAVHSDQALRLLDEPTNAERRLLSAIAYQPNEAVLHTDASILARARRARASWNYLVPGGDQGAPTVTYDMHRLQSLPALPGGQRLLVSLNAGDRVRPERVLARFAYHHPVFDGAAMAAQRLHAKIDGRNHTHFCGAYWGWGFHEDGVRSGIAVARGLGVQPEAAGERAA